MPRKPQQPLKIALVVEREIGYRESLLRGVWRYINQRPPGVELHCQGTDLTLAAVDHIRAWKPDGIVVGMWDFPPGEKLMELGIPMVDVFDWATHLKLPRVGVDNNAVGRMAADHLASLGVRHFGFVGARWKPFARERLAAFDARLAELGHGPAIHAPDDTDMGGVWNLNYQTDSRDSLTRWVKSLPKPIAILGGSDEGALHVLDACRDCRIDVPGQVAVLGVDNDDLLCSISRPPLSSIEIAPERIGYEAMRVLEEWLNGRAVAPDFRLMLQPTHLVTRQSTDVTVVEDDLVLEALKLIRDGTAHGTIDVATVSRQLGGVSRRTLERRFKSAVGHGVLAEILRRKMERARQLLSVTDLNVGRVAKIVGFGSLEQFARQFRRHTGQTPTEFRRHATLAGTE
jgi:LacI family transcriptional regulator